jgi:hypothetical protein
MKIRISISKDEEAIIGPDIDTFRDLRATLVSVFKNRSPLLNVEVVCAMNRSPLAEAWDSSETVMDSERGWEGRG